jgi:flavorubredoxin
MKILIVYYSFSGNTKRACLFLKERLSEASHDVNFIDLRPVDETSSFIKQCSQAVLNKKVKLLDCNYDVAEYGMVIFASPVWAFTMAPALAVYFRNIQNLGKKRAACFLTFGSGVGAKKALGDVEENIRSHQGHILFSKNLSGNKTKLRGYLKDEFASLLELCAS